MSKKAVAVVEDEPNAVATTHDYGSYGGDGFEDVGANELSIPFISILQKSSPQVEDGVLPGAEAGAFFNTVTQEITAGQDGFVFLPCHRDEQWVEWVPRVKGGGFVDTFAPNSELVQELIAKNDGKRIPPKGSDGKRIPFMTPEKNELVETYYVYGLLLDKDGVTACGFAVLSFTSTKITKYKNWITAMKMQAGNPPIFANRAKITSVKESRPSGSSFNYSIAPLRKSWAESLINPKTEKGLMDQALAFREMILSGQAKADLSKQDQVDAADVGEETPF